MSQWSLYRTLAFFFFITWCSFEADIDRDSRWPVGDAMYAAAAAAAAVAAEGEPRPPPPPLPALARSREAASAAATGAEAPKEEGEAAGTKSVVVDEGADELSDCEPPRDDDDTNGLPWAELLLSSSSDELELK